MSNIKIGSPGGVGPSQAPKPDGPSPPGKSFELRSDAASVESPDSASAVEPATIVEQLRTGQVTFDQAVESLVEQALAAQPVAGIDENLRRDIRQALIELIHDDPTLSALASAMKR